MKKEYGNFKINGIHYYVEFSKLFTTTLKYYNKNYKYAYDNLKEFIDLLPRENYEEENKRFQYALKLFNERLLDRNHIIKSEKSKLNMRLKVNGYKIDYLEFQLNKIQNKYDSIIFNLEHDFIMSFPIEN